MIDPIQFEVVTQRPSRSHRRNGGGPQAQRLLDQHQDAHRLLLRLLRPRPAHRRASLRAARASRLALGVRAARRPRLRPDQPRPRRRHPGQRPLPRRRPPQRHHPHLSCLSPSPSGRGPGEGELLGYVANLAHHVDVGGGAPGSIGAFREVFQEGIIIPAVKIMQAAKLSTMSSVSSLRRFARSARLPATSARRWRPILRARVA